MLPIHILSWIWALRHLRHLWMHVLLRHLLHLLLHALFLLHLIHILLVVMILLMTWLSSATSSVHWYAFLLDDLWWLRSVSACIVGYWNVWNMYITVISLMLAKVHGSSCHASTVTGPCSTIATSIVMHDHFRFQTLINDMCIVRRWSSVYTSLLHHKVTSANVVNSRRWLRSSLFLDWLAGRRFCRSLIIIMWSSTILALITCHWLRLRNSTLVHYALIEMLIEWSRHVKAIWVVINHTFCMGFAWYTKLILVISTMTTGLIIQSGLIIVPSNLPHKVIILWNNIVCICILNPTRLISGLGLLRVILAPVLHGQLALIIWLALIHTFHIFSYNVILAWL